MSKTWGFFFGGLGHGSASSCQISANHKFFSGFNVFCGVSTGLKGKSQTKDNISDSLSIRYFFYLFEK